ncbi:hypothetical protein FRC01_007696 [Tulasnella sp. 417]|nr:hypothetical protein FRC01_007696 [Tulasnella sp. 417]
MQIKRQANSTTRAKAIVNKTKGFFGAITNSLKYSEPKAPSFAPLAFDDGSSALADESDRESELFYPTPPFARRFTSNSQRSGSTKSTTSTTISSVFSHRTYETATTATTETDEPYSGKDDGIGAAPKDMDVGVRSFGSEDEYDDDEDEDEDEGVFMRSKRIKPLQAGFVSSVPRNAYAAFLSQPLYKPAYIFPTARRCVDDA